MTTFKEIDINEYKKLLDNMQHTYAKTFNNVELLHNFEENVNNKNIGTIIKDQETLEKEDKYIEKLSNKLSEKFQILILIIIIILYHMMIIKNIFF